MFRHLKSFFVSPEPEQIFSIETSIEGLPGSGLICIDYIPRSRTFRVQVVHKDISFEIPLGMSKDLFAGINADDEVWVCRSQDTSTKLGFKGTSEDDFQEFTDTLCALVT